MKITELVKSEIIKQYGTVKNFANKSGISYTTLTSALTRDTGFNGMAVEKVLKVCDMLGLDISIFDPGIPPAKYQTLSLDEQELIDLYRTLDDRGKSIVKNVSILLVDYKQDADTRVEEAIRTRYIERPLYDVSTSAGTGEFLGSDHYEVVPFPEDVVPPESNFALRVNGDSMEPDYPDGSIVFVKQTREVLHGQVGVFSLNGDSFMKKLGNDNKWKSLNEKYEDIEVHEFDSFRIIGKVVGVYEKEK